MESIYNGLTMTEEGRKILDRLREFATNHSKDSDCTLNETTRECIGCGVYHGDPCLDCGQRAFHSPDCPRMKSPAHSDPEDPDSRVFACETY